MPPNSKTAHTMATRKKNSSSSNPAVKSKPATGVKKTKQAARKRPALPADPGSKRHEAAVISHADIAARAYFIYVNAGCPAGMEVQHWLEAEAQLKKH